MDISRLAGPAGTVLLAAVLAACDGRAPPSSGDALPPATTPPGLEARFQPPPGVRWGTFRNADGARLRYLSVEPAGVRLGTVVVAPGFSENAEKYFETIRDFLGMGLAVWVLDWRGQGGSDRYLAEHDRAHSLGFSRDVRDLGDFLRLVVKAPPGQPTILVSHSMGGNIALRFLEEHPDAVTAAVFSAPALSFGPESGWRRTLLRATVALAAHAGLSTTYVSGSADWTEASDSPQGLSHDAVRGAVQKRWFTANPALRIGGPTYGWMDEFMSSYAVAMNPENLRKATTPSLMGVPLADPVVNPSAELAACAGMPNCRALPFEHSWHELFMESDNIRARWLAAVAAFVAGFTARDAGAATHGN